MRAAAELDTLEDIPPCLLPRLVSPSFRKLPLQGLEEEFGKCVVPWIVGPRDRPGYPMGSQAAPECAGRALDALAVMEHKVEVGLKTFPADCLPEVFSPFLYFLGPPQDTSPLFSPSFAARSCRSRRCRSYGARRRSASTRICDCWRRGCPRRTVPAPRVLSASMVWAVQESAVSAPADTHRPHAFLTLALCSPVLANSYLTFEFQCLVILVREGVAASGERVAAPAR